MALFNRNWRLTIEVNGVAKTYQEIKESDVSLKIEFEVEMSVNGAFSNGAVSIWGLTNDDLNFLTSSFISGNLPKNSLVLEVGYNEVLSMILCGSITECEADLSQPDTRLKVRVMSNFEANLQAGEVKDSISGSATFKSVCQLVAKNNGLALQYDGRIPDKAIGDYSFFGTPFQQIENLRQYQPSDVFIFLQNKKLVVSLIKGGGASKITLDSDSGLIGIPKPSMFGLDVTCLLNTNLTAADFIEIKSRKLPSVNGLYKIITIQHKGGNRSDSWVSHMMLRRA